MWRALVFIALLAAAAFGAVWLAERPGSVVVTWGGYEARTTAAIAAVLVVALALAMVLLWGLARFILELPNRVTRASSSRRRDRGLRALSRGMVAVGAGDAVAARRHAGEAQRLLGREPLTLLLRAQAAQIAGDRPAAESAFRSMTENPETRVLGLRGLYVEARRRGDTSAARAHAAEAARLAPSVSWANEAVLEAQCADGDWRAAIDTVERRAALGLLDKEVARRHRAVLLAADALARAEKDEDGALASALDAVKLAPDLVPAATLAGRILAQRGDLRKAARILETAWKSTPHPDLASVYLHLRVGDSAHDRMKRAETLARLSSWAAEGRLALARAALEAREFETAHQTLAPLLADRPTVRTCLLMADLERAEHGATGKAREWLARATHAARDRAWIADGLVSDRWSPISPVTGRLDAFTWQAPPELISGAGATVMDGVVADLEEEPAEPIVAIPAPEAARSAAQGQAGARDEAATTTAAPAPPSRPVPVTPPEAPGGEVASAEAAARAEDKVAAAPAAEAPKPNGEATDLGPNGGQPREAPEAKPVVFPVAHPPDDPGPEEAKPRPSLFRIFG